MSVALVIMVSMDFFQSFFAFNPNTTKFDAKNFQLVDKFHTLISLLIMTFINLVDICDLKMNLHAPHLRLLAVCTVCLVCMWRYVFRTIEKCIISKYHSLLSLIICWLCFIFHRFKFQHWSISIFLALSIQSI